MGKENTIQPSQDFIPVSLPEKALGALLRPGSRFLSERILEHAQVDISQETLIEYVNAIDAGYLPIIVTNHSSHADAATSSSLIKKLIKVANGALPLDQQMEMFTVPLAASLPEGQQGQFLRQVFFGAKPVIERAGFNPNYITRPKDRLPVKPAGEKPDSKRWGYGMRDNTKAYLKRHIERTRGKTNGILLYPEGTTEGGKAGPDGLPIGMIPFEEDSISIHLRLLKKHTGRKAMIIYAGITGSTNAIDPDTKKIPLLRALDSARHPDQYKITVGGIILEDDPEFAELSTSKEINDFIGRKIAQLLPPEMRGVYAQAA